MMKILIDLKKTFILVLLISTIISCKDDTETNRLKSVELELRKRELDIKERELEIKSKEKTAVLPKALNLLYNENVESIFLIEATNQNQTTSLGSGFFIREDGLGVSNYHVLSDAESAIIHTNSGRKFMISEIVNYSKESDYVVFKISNSSYNNFRAVKFAQITPKVGEDCFAIGNPKGLTQTLSKGIISGFRDNYIQTTAQITNGSSGGALFNNNGEVIGITTMGYKEADLNFALNTINFNFFQENNLVRQPIIKESSNYKTQVASIIETYFNALANNNFDILNDLFASKFTRFYNEFDLSKYQAINEHRKYAETYPNPKSIINYNSIRTNQDYDSSITVNLKFSNTIKRNSWKNSRTYDFDMFIRFNKNLKINSVFTNIIEK